MNDIAATAGVTKGALYWHFEGKDALLIEMLRILREQWRDSVPTPAAEQEPELTLIKLSEQHDYFDERLPWRQQLMFTLGMDVENLSPKVFRAMVQGQETIASYVTELVQSGQRSGRFRADLDPRVTTLALMLLRVGVLVSWYQFRRSFSLRELDRSCLEVMLRGLLSKDPGCAPFSARFDPSHEQELEAWVQKRISGLGLSELSGKAKKKRTKGKRKHAVLPSRKPKRGP
jgi:AcrR family transcriptional regulator